MRYYIKRRIYSTRIAGWVFALQWDHPWLILSKREREYARRAKLGRYCIRNDYDG